MSDEKKPEARIFPVDTRFHQLARRPGATSRDEAIKKAQAQIDEVKPTFGGWLEQQLQELITAVRSITQTDPVDLDGVRAAFLCSRRLADVGTTMGYALVTFVADNLSKILEAVEDGADYRADIVDCHVEALLLAKQEQYRNMRPEQLPELSSGLRRVIESVKTSG